MTEEKKEGSCYSSGGHCCKAGKLIFGLLLAAFIFASGMWFAKAHCHCCHMGGGYCPFSSAPATK